MTPPIFSTPVLMDEDGALRFSHTELPDSYVEGVLKAYAGIVCVLLLASASYLLASLPVIA